MITESRLASLVAASSSLNSRVDALLDGIDQTVANAALGLDDALKVALVTPKAIYVDGVAGLDSNPGTMEAPVKTLAAAATLSTAKGYNRVQIYLYRGQTYACPTWNIILGGITMAVFTAWGDTSLARPVLTSTANGNSTVPSYYAGVMSGIGMILTRARLLYVNGVDIVVPDSGAAYPASGLFGAITFNSGDFLLANCDVTCGSSLILSSMVPVRLSAIGTAVGFHVKPGGSWLVNNMGAGTVTLSLTTDNGYYNYGTIYVTDMNGVQLTGAQIGRVLVHNAIFKPGDQTPSNVVENTGALTASSLA